jgi:hypothetical protein
VDILVDETRLPDGPEQEPEDDSLEKANERLEKTPVVAGVTLEAVRMDW